MTSENNFYLNLWYSFGFLHLANNFTDCPCKKQAADLYDTGIKLPNPNGYGTKR